MSAFDFADSHDASISLADARLTPDVSGALWWEGMATLVVSDLHLEKGSAYAKRGVPLPPYDTRATIARLARAIARFRPYRVVALGDSFHDAETDARMHADDRDALARLVGRVESWVWIVGNHDPEPPRHLGGTVMDELRLDGLVFRHEPRGEDGEVAGHLHPCARVAGRTGSLRRRCFATDGARLVAPAFGAYAGGLNVCDPAFTEVFPGEPPTVHVLGRYRVWTVGFASLLPD
jgi:DNA ligase-associated metallophosphoesterase